jgi:hypothetical protein
MADPALQLGELFAIRPAGVPFDVLEALGTPAISAAARAALAAEVALATAVPRAVAAVDRAPGLSDGQRLRLRRKLFKRLPIPIPSDDPAAPASGPPAAALALDELAEYRRLLAEVAAAERAVGAALPAEYAALRERLYALAQAHLPDLAVLQLTRDQLARMLEQRTPKADRALAIWIQRVCAKNDTISRFGPSAWGRIDPAEPGVRLSPAPGIARRVAWVERWVVRAVLDAINADPEAAQELAPRPLGAARDPAVRAALAADDLALLARCDGATPAHALAAAAASAPAAGLARLVAAGAVRWSAEPVFIDDAPLATLAADVARWRPGPPRARWAAVLDRLAAAAAQLQAAPDVGARQGALDAVYAVLAELGTAPRARTGRLYEAANPLVENCARAGDFALGGEPARAAIADAAPWLALFRDACALAARRVYTGLRPLITGAPRRAGRLTLAELLAHARASGVELGSAAPSRLAEAAFGEIRARLAQQLADRAHAPECALTDADCAALRDLAPPRPDLPLPSVDLQLAAPSAGAVARGDYRWVVAEVHPHFAIMGQSLSWSCPDPARLAAQLRAAQGPEPIAFFDAPGALLAPVHISNESIVTGLASAHVVTDHRTRAGWLAHAPRDVVVDLDDDRADVRLRSAATGDDLGSLFPLPRYFFGLHPFFPVQLTPHTPRLVRGRTVLQRRAWLVTAAELGGPFDELAPALVLAVERLRAARDLPRWVFMRLRSDVLSGADASARRKDAKPICIDLESQVLLEIFARRLAKYGAVELVEMLPAPEDLLWREADGRRCFELRALIVPAGTPVTGGADPAPRG